MLMLKARVYDFTLFFIALSIAFGADRVLVDKHVYINTLIIFWIFSILYFHLRVINKKMNMSIDYGINYDLSFAMLAGPSGLFLFEFIYRFSLYLYKKATKTADPGEFLDTFYNIGSFVITNSAAFYLFQFLYPNFHSFPFGFWIVMLMVGGVSSFLSDMFLVTVFYILGDLKTVKEGLHFILTNRSVLDYIKIAVTNGLLFLLVQAEKWEMVIALFILNYIVSRSFYDKSQSVQNKNERDKFELMAYTDFLTGVYNRTYMDKKMAELNQACENVGIVVCDIDKFKGINDNYNHAVGDKVIHHFAAELKSHLTEEDFLFRSGGEEFTLCLRGRNYEQTVALVEKMLAGSENYSVGVEFNGESISISYTASFGLYFYKVDEQLPMEKGYVIADQLLLQSKQLGKNRLSAVCGSWDNGNAALC